MIIEEKEGQPHEAGEDGEAEHDDLAPLAHLPQLPHVGIGQSGPEAPGHAHQRRKTGQAGGGAYHQRRPGKGHQDAEDVHAPGQLLENEDGHDDGEEGGELVEHVGVGDADMTDGPEVGDQPRGAEGAALEKGEPAPGMDTKALAGPEKHDRGKRRRHQIAEEGLLHHRHVTAQPHEQRHDREEKRRQEDTEYPPDGLITFCRRTVHNTAMVFFFPPTVNTGGFPVDKMQEYPCHPGKKVINI